MDGMHEISIVRRIIDMAEGEARQAGSSSIRLIRLKVGEFRGVAVEALEFGFAVLKKGTLADGARLEVELVQLRLDCHECGQARTGIGDLSFICPGCGGRMNLSTGRELELDYLEID